MVLDGFLGSSTEARLAYQLGVSSRHLRRLFREHLGVTPSELAKSSRAHFTRRLLDDTDLTVTEIAFAAGFGSVRQMNRVVREIFRSTPTELRAKRRRSDRLVADGGLPLRLPFDGPFDWPPMLRLLESWAVPGVESVSSEWYRRTVVIDGDPGVLEIRPLDDQHLMVVAHLPHWESLMHIARRASAIFGLAAPTPSARVHLGRDPFLRPLVEALPGLRVPGAWDPFEIAVVGLIAQEKPLVEARLIAGRLVELHGRHVPGLLGLGLTHVFPEPSALRRVNLDELDITDRTRHAILALSKALADEDLTLDSWQDAEDLVSSLSQIPGITRTTTEYIAWRLGLRDVLPISKDELATRLKVRDSGLLEARVESWQPWRSLAASYLMAQVEPGHAGGGTELESREAGPDTVVSVLDSSKHHGPPPSPPGQRQLGEEGVDLS